MINVENVTKSFGANTLFDGISFKINSGEKIGLVGRNGHGKTTLFRLITGDDYFEDGAIAIPKNYRISCVSQQLVFTEDTILKEAEKGLPAHERNQSWKVEKILAGLGFPATELNRHPKEFSGGFQVRLNLAKALASAPDLLLLDEPTNYLDITSIRWLERFLNKWPRELMLISHNRGFMDKIVTHVAGIYRKKIRKIAGNTEKYYNWIARDEEIYEKTRVNDERRRKETQLFISRFRAKARLANLVQSRIKSLNRRDKKEKLEKHKTLQFSFSYLPFKGNYMMSAQDVSFAYESGDTIIKDFNISIRAGEKICVVGQNGTGKTTLVKLLAGVLHPDQGEIKYSPAVLPGFFEQTNIESLNPDYTVEEEILSSRPGVERQMARNICGAMMFSGETALKKIRVLSGGEKSRVMLGKLIATPVNMLFLDEPTNHLDMESSDALLTAIAAFNGSVVMVTHNETFLHALANRLIVFKNGSVEIFEGTYQDFLDKGGWEDNVETESFDKKRISDKKRDTKKNKSQLRREKSRLLFERSQALNPLKQKINEVETEIGLYETTQNNLNSEIAEAALQNDGKKIETLSKEIHACTLKINSLYDELELLTDTLTEKEEKFDKLASVYVHN